MCQGGMDVFVFVAVDSQTVGFSMLFLCYFAKPTSWYVIFAFILSVVVTCDLLYLHLWSQIVPHSWGVSSESVPEAAHHSIHISQLPF